MAYPTYSSYRDSGVAWLGEVPKHWEVIKNKFIFNFSKGLTITKENLSDEGVPCVNYGEIHSHYGFEVNPKQHALKCVYQSQKVLCLIKGILFLLIHPRI